MYINQFFKKSNNCSRNSEKGQIISDSLGLEQCHFSVRNLVLNVVFWARMDKQEDNYGLSFNTS